MNRMGLEFAKAHPDLKDIQRAYTKWLKAHKSELWPLDRYKFIDNGGIEDNFGSRSHLTPDSRTLSADAQRSESRRWR